MNFRVLIEQPDDSNALNLAQLWRVCYEQYQTQE
jgi:hypothetical protein